MNVSGHPRHPDAPKAVPYLARYSTRVLLKNNIENYQGPTTFRENAIRKYIFPYVVFNFSVIMTSYYRMRNFVSTDKNSKAVDLLNY